MKITKEAVYTELYIYSAIILFSIIIEASTSALVSIWFIPGAILGILLSILNVSIAVQIIVFFTTSILLMLLFYKKLRDVIALKTEKTNVDALIGKEAIAEEDISYLKPGRVKVNGMSWSAYIKKGDKEIQKGDTVRILSIDGVKLLCQKLDENAVTQQVLVNK